MSNISSDQRTGSRTFLVQSLFENSWSMRKNNWLFGCRCLTNPCCTQRCVNTMSFLIPSSKNTQTHLSILPQKRKKWILFPNLWFGQWLWAWDMAILGSQPSYDFFTVSYISNIECLAFPISDIPVPTRWLPLTRTPRDLPWDASQVVTVFTEKGRERALLARTTTARSTREALRGGEARWGEEGNETE